jgi:hypothetical protein
MDDRGTVSSVDVPAPRDHRDADPVHVIATGVGSPPLPVLARVSHVFCGRAGRDVWPMLHRELRAGTVVAGDLVLLRIGRGAAEQWSELTVGTVGDLTERED